MTNDLALSYRLRDHLGMYWLRPESALWDAIAAHHIQPQLEGRRNILELGIGNGFFSFLMLGGSFSPEFDWFRNINVEGFWSNADVFDSVATVDPAEHIARRPTVRIRYGLDHKRNLLDQAARLGLVDKLICHDGNQPIELPGVDTVYSNIIYWLDDPMAVLEHLGRLLSEAGGRVVVVFPNSHFYAACRSYNRDSTLWRLVNRGAPTTSCGRWTRSRSRHRCAREPAFTWWRCDAICPRKRSCSGTSA